jgi:hypothetical protein
MKRPQSSRCPSCVGVGYQEMCKKCKSVAAEQRRTRKRNVTSTGRGAAWHDALTRNDIMVARGYHQELIDMNRERINEERDNK